jgi:single-strand DNA-binding protein
MASLNQCNFIGNLVRDPEMKFIPNGKAVTNFTIACNERWKEQTGEVKESVEYVKIVAWGKFAENCEKLLSKGKLVFVSGKLQTRPWEDRNGNKRYTTEVVANQMQVLSPTNSSEGGYSNNEGDSGFSPKNNTPVPQEFNDIPF